MKEEKPINQETLPDKIGNYFEHEQENIEEKSDSNSNKEKNELFTYDGGFANIDVWIKHEEFRLKFEEFKLKRADADSERDLREKNANLAFKFSVIWAVFIGILILLHAMNKYFILKEIEFLTVIGTLTPSILIYYLCVIKYLFYRK